jgi:lipoyl(octanoyl) transferase
VGYPILQLGAIRKDVVWYVRMLEEVMIRTTREFGICAEREAGKTGIWVPGEKKEFIRSSPRGEQPAEIAAEKLGAIGVHISRWVTSHGFAYNVSTDLRNFDLIVPCGIAGRKATSLEKLLGRAVNGKEVAPKMVRHFGDVFGLEIGAGTKEELLGMLELREQMVALPA